MRITTDEGKLYKDMHRIKVKIAISASLLIGATFVGIFMGAFKVNLGMEDKKYVGYKNFYMPVPERGDQPWQVVAYTTRTITQYNDESLQSTTRLASVVRFDMPTGRLAWNLSDQALGIHDVNVGLVENVNEWYGGGPDGPLLLVQFASVSATETMIYETHSDGGHSKMWFRNETGSYQTFTWNFSAPSFDASRKNITDAIGAGSRAIGVIRLLYNASDSLADYIIVSTNRTWEKDELQLPLSFGEGILYKLFAMHANGSLAWSVDSNTTGSIINFGSTFIWSDVYGFALNSSHFVITLPDSKVALGSIGTGSKVWDATLITDIIGAPCDHSGDDRPDLVCIDTSNNIICIDGTNGTAVSNFTAIPLGTNHFCPLRVASRYGFPYDLILVEANTGHVQLYQHNATTVSMLWEKDIGGYEVYNMRVSWKHYNDYLGSAVLLLQVGFPGGEGNKLYRYYNAESGAVITEASRGRDDAFTGDFFTQWEGLEIVSVESDNGYYVQSASQATKRMFELDDMYLVALVVAVAVGLVSGLILIKARRTHARLSSKEEEMQTVVVANETSITTTRKTTRPLRSLSMAMLLVILASAIMFIVYIVVIGTGDNYYNSENFYAIRNGYITIGLTLVSLPIIAVLYNYASPGSAMLQIKIQRFFYKVLFKGKKEHRVLVLDMSDYAKKFSIPMIIGRSMFPLLVSITLGLTVFGALATDTSGIGGTTGSINLIFISEFELYAGLTFIGSYLLMAFISPGGWLLDDSGVVYFEQPVDTHHPGDISKISDWLTGWLKGFFGFTALLNYYNLFADTDLTKLVDMGDILSAILLVVFVFGIMIIASPLLYGLIAMFSSNASMIDDLEYNRERLYAMLRKSGVDVTPKRLKDFFER